MKRIWLGPVLVLLLVAFSQADSRPLTRKPGNPMATVHKTIGDTARTLGDLYAGTTVGTTAVTDGTHSATAILLVIEDNSARLGCGGSTPDQGGTPDELGILLVNGASILLEGAEMISSCKLINNINGSDAEVGMMPFWGD